MREEQEPSSFDSNNVELLINKFEVMLSEEQLYFFDVAEFEDVIDYYIIHNKLKKAKRALVLAKSQHPASLEFTLKEAEIHSINSEFDSALRLLKQVELIDQSNPEVFISKGEIYHQKNDFKKAITAFNKALALSDESNRESLQLSVSYAYYNAGDMQSAIDVLKKLVEENPDHGIGLFELSKCYEELSSDEDGIEYFKNFVDTHPFNEHAWYLLGNLQSAAGRFEDAVVSYDFAIVLMEDFEAAHYSKSNLLSRLGRYKEAIEGYKISLKYNEGSYILYYYIGECLENLEEYAEAIYYYHKSVELDGDFSAAWQGISTSYLELGHLDEAKKYINKAIQSEPDDPVYWDTLAQIETARGEIELAVFAFERVIELDEEDQEVYMSYIEVVYSHYGVQDALNIAKKGLEKFPSNVELIYLSAALYYLSGDKAAGFELCALGLDESEGLLSTVYNLEPELLTNPDFQEFIEQHNA